MKIILLYFRHVIGVAIRRNIENKLISSESSRTDQIVTCLDRMYSKLPKCSNLGLVSRALEVENYVLVLDSQGIIIIINNIYKYKLIMFLF